VATTFETSTKLGRALLEAMGLDVKDVLAITLHCEAGELPTVTLRLCVPQGLAEKAQHILQQFRVEFTGSVPLADLDESVCLTSQIHTTHHQAG